MKLSGSYFDIFIFNFPSIFDIPCSIFDIRYSSTLFAVFCAETIRPISILSKLEPLARTLAQNLAHVEESIAFTQY
jgi:hypothetical protein